MLESVLACENPHRDVPSPVSIIEGNTQYKTCPAFYASFSGGKTRRIPQIQHDFDLEFQTQEPEMIKRQEAVRRTFQHSWNGYYDRAWLRDEVLPISGGHRDTLGGWAATLVDSLDTLLIMNLDSEFEEALEAISEIDFSNPKLPDLNVFETTIRYLGGLISAYDLTEGKYPILLNKAHELGEFLYGAFDTPNGMPQMRWPWSR